MMLNVVLFAMTLLLGPPASAQDEPERRTLQPVPEDVVRIEVTLERIDERDTAAAVALDYRFAAGDRVRFEVRPSHDGYFAIGTFGDGDAVAKAWPEAAEGHFVRADDQDFLPQVGGLRIRGKGPTRVALLFSPTALRDLEAAEPEGGTATGRRRLKKVYFRGSLEVDAEPVRRPPRTTFQNTLHDGEVAVIEITLSHD